MKDRSPSALAFFNCSHELSPHQATLFNMIRLTFELGHRGGHPSWRGDT